MDTKQDQRRPRVELLKKTVSSDNYTNRMLWTVVNGKSWNTRLMASLPGQLG